MTFNKKVYAGGAVAAGLALLVGWGITNNGSGLSETQKPTTQNETGAQRNGSYMEDKTGSEDVIDIEQAKKKAEEIAEMRENIDKPQPNEHPSTIGIQGHNYFIYGDGLLLPIGEEWNEYVVPAAKDGSYESISEYYLKEESPEIWTQKFSIHKVNNFAESCPEFADRLVNGILVTLSDRMELEDKSLTKDDVSFNFARKEDGDVILYWGMPGQEEVQFVRVFRSEYSKDLYVATSSYKMDISSADEDFVGNKMAELASIQQLKKKG